MVADAAGTPPPNAMANRCDARLAHSHRTYLCSLQRGHVGMHQELGMSWFTPPDPTPFFSPEGWEHAERAIRFAQDLNGDEHEAFLSSLMEIGEMWIEKNFDSGENEVRLVTRWVPIRDGYRS